MNINMLYFQFFTHSIIALIKIAKAHPEVYGKIISALNLSVMDESYINRIIGGSGTLYPYEVIQNVKNIVEQLHVKRSDNP